jgi:hypothetical protein
MIRNRFEGLTALRLVLFLLLLATTVSPEAARARTWRVPQDVGTVKEAVEDSAAYGDTVLVASGTYSPASGEVFPIAMANGVVLVGENGPESTILDAAGTARVIQGTGLDSTTVIVGFTLTGGLAPAGGGLSFVDSDLLIRENVITGNIANGRVGSGGGLSCNGGAPTVADNVVADNIAESWMGGGIYFYECTGEITGNTICGNTAVYGAGIFNDGASPLIAENHVEGNTAVATGGGIDCYRFSSAVIERNVVVGNHAGDNAPGIACCFDSSPIIIQNTVARNIADYGGGVRTRTNSSAHVSKNAIVDNVDGLFLEQDADALVAHDNSIYFNTYQPGDFEVWNTTSIQLDLTGNFWWATDSASVALLIQGDALFAPVLASPSPDAPGEPSAVWSVTVMQDATYASPLEQGLDVGDTLFIELTGADWNDSLVDPAIVILSTAKDPAGIAAALVETGPGSGVYRGTAHITSTSCDLFNEIAADERDAVVVRANMDPAVGDTVAVGTGTASDGPPTSAAPSELGLIRIAPNPCRGPAEIFYEVPAACDVVLQLYNCSGRLVRALSATARAAGTRSVVWDGLDCSAEPCPNGVYLLRMRAVGDVATNHIVMAR